LVALDLLFEQRAIRQVLEDQEGLVSAWTNALTGTSGTVSLVATGQIGGLTCMVIDYPSMMPSIDGNTVVSARERYCRSEGELEWFSDEVLHYDAYIFEDPEAGPKTLT
jgi:hypothetical protein